jgi:hypothetical protein
VKLEAAAAATAQRASTVQAGLEWLAARGQITIVDRDETGWRLAAGPGPSGPGPGEFTRTRLEALLAETAAYRAYLRQAPAASLLS